MSKIYLLFIFFFLSTYLSAQIESNDYFEVLYTAKGKAGVQYAEKGYFIINPKVADQSSFLLDSLGNKIELPCQGLKLDRGGNMKKGNRYYCQKDGRSALYSFSEKSLTTAFHENINMLNDNFYVVKEADKTYLYNIENKLLLELDSLESLQSSFLHHFNIEHIHLHSKGQLQAINYKGEIDKDHVCGGATPFPSGAYRFKENKKYGLKSAEGEILVPAKYDTVSEWQDGKYIVGIESPPEEGKKSMRNSPKILKGVVDKTGNFLLPMEYDYIRTKDYGLVGRKPYCQSIFFNESLENIYKKEYESIRIHKNGLITVKDDSGTYFDFAYSTSAGTLKKDIKSGSGVTDEISKLQYADGNIVLVNKLGQTVFDPKGKKVRYDKINDDLIKVEIDFKTGLLDAQGKWMFELANQNIRGFKNLGGILIYNLENNTRKLMNAEGQEIASNVENAVILSPKHAYILSKNGKVGVLNKKGEILIPFEHYKVRETFNNSNFYTIIDKNRLRTLVRIKKR